MVKHISTKRKRTFKNKLKIAGATALGLIGLAVPTLANETQANIQTKPAIEDTVEAIPKPMEIRFHREMGGTSSNTWFGIGYGSVNVNAYIERDSENPSDNNYAVHFTQGFNVGETPMTLWTRLNDGNPQVGLDATVGRQYIFAPWVTWDDKGKIESVAVGGTGSLPLKGNTDLVYGIFHFENTDATNTQGSYLGIKTPQFSVGLVEDYDDTVRLDGGVTNGELGALVDFRYEKNGDWRLKTKGAENPTAILGPSFLETAGLIFGLGEFSETQTHFSEGAKSKQGYGVNFDVEKEGDVYTYTPEIGYQFENGIGVCAGATFSDSDSTQPHGAVSYKMGGLYGEVRYSAEDGLEGYVRATVDIF